LNLIIPIVILLSWKEIKKDEKSHFKGGNNSPHRLMKIYISLILLVNLFGIKVFFVTDLLLFYISFEAILIPMFYLIGFFGSRNKRIELAQNTFFLYTLFGSLFM
jgi:NADH-quinone oxidoreductase subunit M